MFENFKKLTIKGGCFQDETELELFKKDAVSIIYGRNGSGKITIAYSIDELSKNDEEKSDDFTVTSDTVIPEDKKNSIFIFNEDFIQKQVRIEKEGINTIVMLGEQVELDAQIKAKQIELNTKEEEYNKLNEEKEKYENEKEDISPLFHFKQIRNILRADKGWADIDRDLKGNTLKSHIKDDVIETIMNLEEPKETDNQLKEKVNADLKLYKETNNAQRLEWERPQQIVPEQLEPLGDLLSKQLDTPILSDREKRLMNLLESHPEHSREETKKLLAENWTFCPTCLREITEQDKDYITKTLTRILSEEANKYQSSLQKMLETYDFVKMEQPEFTGGLNEREINSAYTASINLNNILKKTHDKISQRKNHIYESILNPFSEDEYKEYTEAVAAWKNALNILDECVKRFNDSVDKHAKLYNQVRSGNNKLARKHLALQLSSYKKAKENKYENERKWKEKSDECEKVRGEIKQLIAQKERTDIALDYINNELQYVFYSKRKMKLEPGDGCYKLKVNGRAVKPKKISIGERNVLGLCYFFAKLFGGKTETNKYAFEYLIVIDDPISSFDYGNRVGVMSLLRFQFNNILKGNPNSRILVMSHDLYSVFDLMKIRNDITNERNPFFIELANNQLKEHKKRNEYEKLLQNVYSYAANTYKDEFGETSEIGIGNIMRRMLEAFSTFCYGVSFEKMVRRDDVLELIPKEKQSYYGNFMYRLTLNSESHMEENMYTLNSITTYFTKDEKVQTAKSVLLFLLYINRQHLAAYLKEEELNEIEGWKTEENRWIINT